jgi:hypothetical protein
LTLSAPTTSSLFHGPSKTASYFRSYTPVGHIAMPSIFKKLSGSSKNNPYVNPHHPSHAPVPSKLQPPAPRPASPRGSIDHLAEARISAGRDPVTGRAKQRPHDGPTSRGVRTNDAVQQSNSSDGRSAFASRSAKTMQTTGSKYDLFVQMMAEKKHREMAPGNLGKAEFYAPERRIAEFYAGGVGR